MVERQSAVEFNLYVEPGADVDERELDEITRQLFRSLEESEPHRIDFVTEPAPAGAKTTEAVTIGAIIVAALPIALPKIIDTLRAWLLAHSARIIKLKIVSKSGAKIELEAPSGHFSESQFTELLATLRGSPSDPK